MIAPQVSLLGSRLIIALSGAEATRQARLLAKQAEAEKLVKLPQAFRLGSRLIIALSGAEASPLAAPDRAAELL